MNEVDVNLYISSIAVRDLEKFGFVESDGHMMRVCWSCELWTNHASKWRIEGIRITDDSETIKISTALQLARFVDFENFISGLRR